MKATGQQLLSRNVLQQLEKMKVIKPSTKYRLLALQST